MSKTIMAWWKEIPLGKSPNDWEVKRLGDIAILEYGFSLKNSDRSGGVYPVYGSNGVVGFHNKPFVIGPGIVIGRKGSVGKVQFVKDSFCPIDTAYYVKVKYPQVLLEYLYRTMLMMRLDKMDSSSAVPGLNRNDAYTRHVPIPPLPEQRKIAAILSSVDDAIEKTKAVIEQTRVVKKGLMQELLTRGIPGRHKKFKKTPVGEIPVEWEEVRLEKVATIERGKFQHRPRNEPKFYGGKYPFVQTGDVTASGGRIKSYSQTLNDEGLAISKLFPQGTILITIAANIGETAIAEFDLAFPDSLIGIIVNRSMDNRFLEYYLRTRKVHLNQIATESAQKNINLETLKPYPVPVPCKEEQKSIADFIECIEAKESNNKKIFDGLQLIKTVLMQVLLTGEVRVKVT